MCKIFKIIILFISVNCFANFTPIDAEVTVGDESIKNTIAVKRNYEPVYGAGQTGSFFMIRFYQRIISPQSMPSCPFSPTCSAYGRQAVQKHGGFWGAFLSGERILRCNPFNHSFGEDQVPQKLFGK